MSDASKSEIKIRVLFFGAARDVAGSQTMEMFLPSSSTLEAVSRELIKRFPGLEKFGRSLLFAVNQEYANRDTAISKDDEVAVFPPVSGGSEVSPRTEVETRDAPDFCEVTTKPLDVGSIARRVVLPECGATVTLDGYAREWTKGRRTRYLVYESYDQMALTEMGKLIDEAHKCFDIAHVGIVHRIGRLEIGETSVVIAVSAPHRRAAFEACEWIITELKRTVPIWKKEVFEDGEAWV
ncbi:MAG: molybdenum cofactor biosynthesis protein MoaE [Pyrinomonadaceae bacterium]